MQASSQTGSRNATSLKAAAGAAVIDDLDAINFAARALAVTTPGLEDKFRLPRKANEQEVLASARAFAIDATPLKDKFIAFEMPANSLEDLAADIADLEAALSRRRSTRTSQVRATALMEAALTEALEIFQQLKVVVHNKVKDDDGLMAAWLRASRSETRHSRSTSVPVGTPAVTSGPDTQPTDAKPPTESSKGW